ncbi:DUF2252 domain-containing protein [Methylocystis sp. 9N]|uniref:DUF2252 domain-containing protein n=1 Tax=Methylocystis borbori TaxID=3118750 RepID=A0ABU7XG14_9HYPH
MTIEAEVGAPDLNGLDHRARYAAGKALRDAVKREALADFAPAPERDALAIIAATERDRVQSLLPLRRESMAVSPHAFLRGAADVMASDLSTQLAPGVRAQAGGDCHLMNFGAFISPEGQALFDVNDFDETLPNVDVTFDLRRLATSVVIAALGAGETKPAARRIARATMKTYRRTVAALARLSPLEAWNMRVPLADVADSLRNRVLHAAVHRAISKDRDADYADNFPKIEQDENGAWRIKDKPPRLFHIDGEIDMQVDRDALIAAALATLPAQVAALLRRYDLDDIAFKAVGVGSVGTRCVIALLMTPDEEPLFLQVKEAGRSVLERFGVGAWSGAQGERVVTGQRMMQAASDIFLGFMRDPGSGREFYMRHLKTRRLGSLTELMQQHALLDYAKLCGCVLARAHARSTDAAALAGYMGKSAAFDDALASFAMLYARQNAKDYEAFLAQAALGA